MADEKKLASTTEKVPLKKLLLLCCMWGVIFITALILIINLFQSQWQQILETVSTYIQTNPQDLLITTNNNTEENTSVNEQTEPAEATTSSQQNLTFDATFIEGLLEVISTSASTSAQTATASVQLP